MDTIQRQWFDQKIWKLVETASFSDVYKEDNVDYFIAIKDYIHLNGEKYRPQDFSHISIFRFLQK